MDNRNGTPSGTEQTTELSVSDVEPIQVPKPSFGRKKAPPPDRRQIQGRPSSVDLTDKTVIDGRYEVVQTLGSGAMGTVFLVKHLRLGKLFALKMVNPELTDLPEYVERFEREADACSRLDHPNCISVTDFGQTRNGSLYLVMQYADGTPLSNVVHKGPVSPKEALEYVRQILLGLKHAHAGGLIHRDIKLENIVKCRGDDDQVVLKILDFGMAREPPRSSDDAKITREGVVMGTPHYMAPEQLKHQTIDERVDLYATGVTLFRLITGRPLFESRSSMEILAAKLKHPAPTLKQITGNEYPEVLESFIAKALERNPDERFSSAAEMLAALDKVEAELEAASASGKTAPGFSRLPRQGVALLGSAVRAARDFSRAVIQDARNWWACAEQSGAPSWPNRLRGLTATRSGRVLLIRSVAVAALLIAVSTSVLRPSAKVPRPAGPKSATTASTATTATADPAKRPDMQINTPVKATPESEPSADPALIEAALLIEKKRCKRAEKELGNAADSNSPRALYLQGRVKMCLGQTEEALSVYKSLVAADQGYKTDSRILEDAEKMTTRQKTRIAALDFMAEDLGKPALPTLIQFAGRHPNREVRRHAQELVERQGALEHVNLEAALDLDLNQAGTCKEKREAVRKLGELGTKRARAVLVRARDAEVKEGLFRKRPKHECVRRDILRALSGKRI